MKKLISLIIIAIFILQSSGISIAPLPITNNPTHTLRPIAAAVSAGSSPSSAGSDTRADNGLMRIMIGRRPALKPVIKRFLAAGHSAFAKIDPLTEAEILERTPDAFQNMASANPEMRLYLDRHPMTFRQLVIQPAAGFVDIAQLFLSISFYNERNVADARLTENFRDYYILINAIDIMSRDSNLVLFQKSDIKILLDAMNDSMGFLVANGVNEKLLRKERISIVSNLVSYSEVLIPADTPQKQESVSNLVLIFKQLIEQYPVWTFSMGSVHGDRERVYREIETAQKVVALEGKNYTGMTEHLEKLQKPLELLKLIGIPPADTRSSSAGDAELYQPDDREKLEELYFGIAKSELEINEATVDKLLISLPSLIENNVYTPRDIFVWIRANRPETFRLCQARYDAIIAEDPGLGQALTPIWQGICRTILDNNFDADPHATGFEIGDPDQQPFPNEIKPERLISDMEALEGTAAESHSGIRAIFDILLRVFDGVSTNVSDAAKIRTAAITKGFVDFLRRDAAEKEPEEEVREVVVAIDTRFTGQTLADIAVRSLLSEGISVRYTFVSNVVEAIIYTREVGANGFIYISASHNPVGYNGVKLGKSDGKIISAEEAERFIRDYQQKVNAENLVEYANGVATQLNSLEPVRVREVYESVGGFRVEGRRIYDKVSDRVITGRDKPHEVEAHKAQFAELIGKNNYFVIADPCGGTAQERDYLESYNFRVREINNRMRFDMTAHDPNPIDENSMRDVVISMLEALKSGENVLFGIGYDTDRDRKNIALTRLRRVNEMRADMADALFMAEIDKIIRKAKAAKRIEDFAKAVNEIILMPGVQNLFAFDYIERIAETALREEWVIRGEDGSLQINPDKPIDLRKEFGVCVNDATSLIVEQIDAMIGTTTRRAETGEPNIVTAGEERQQALMEALGYDEEKAKERVLALAEGTHASVFSLDVKVREPRQCYKTILGFIGGEELFGADLFEVWCLLSGQMDRYQEDADLADIVETLPPEKTTTVFDSRGIYRGPPLPCELGQTSDWLKGAFKVAFRSYVEENVVGGIKAQIAQEMAKAGERVDEVTHEWKYYREQREIDDICGDGRGGMSCWFYVDGRPIMFLWIRASVTETEITRKMVSVSFWKDRDETRKMIDELYSYAYKELNAALKKAESQILKCIDADTPDVETLINIYGACRFATPESITRFLPQAKEDIGDWQEKLRKFKPDPFSVLIRPEDRERARTQIIEALSLEGNPNVRFKGVLSGEIRDGEYHIFYLRNVVFVVVNSDLRESLDIQLRNSILKLTQSIGHESETPQAVSVTHTSAGASSIVTDQKALKLISQAA
ncbi:MAG: hypothetical protein HQ572_04335 [Candidatus Omnitrophica bacterium]|nr:hypothetical protein [Candidatus Omnitrophota bacterium]